MLSWHFCFAFPSKSCMLPFIKRLLPHNPKKMIYLIQMTNLSGITRHGILYNSSTSQNCQFSRFCIFFWVLSLIIATIDNINQSNQWKITVDMPISGNNATFCGKHSKNLLPQPSFEEFHKSFHNLKELFRKQWALHCCLEYISKTIEMCVIMLNTFFNFFSSFF